MSNNCFNLAKVSYIYQRSFSTSDTRFGVHNFNKFIYYGRGSKQFKREQARNPDPDIPHYTWGVRHVGYRRGKRLVVVPEKIPEIIMPDLTGFKLKPYVSYKVPEINQAEFTAKELFDAAYSHKIAVDFRNGKLDEDGNTSEPNKYEKMTATEAHLKARQTGSDLFMQDELTDEEAAEKQTEMLKKLNLYNNTV